MTMAPLRILFCTSEAVPFAQTGGLAEMTFSLASALRDRDCDVRLLLPYYRQVRTAGITAVPLAEGIPLEIGIHHYHGHLWQTETAGGMPVYLLEKEEFYDRSHLYGSPRRGDYEDNAQRFIAYCRSVPTLCAHLDWHPQILHLHDWQTALAAAYLHFYWHHDARFAATRSVFTIHNLGYQGIFPGSVFELTRLPPEAFRLDGIEYWGQCNFLKAGLQYAHKLTTVSPTYSREIQQPEFGFGLHEAIRARKDDLVGILNGIDTHRWNPRTDPHLPHHYDADRLDDKLRCKQALLEELNLPKENVKQPLLAMVGRLAQQKGVELLQGIFEELMTLPVTMIILGTGDPATEDWLRRQATLYPNKFRAIMEFDEGLAHRIEAGADIFLMPSRYEPCGLNQLYSLCYGTVPVVHAVGGLEDSVIDMVEDPKHGTGFKFRDYSPAAFFAAIRTALAHFEHPERWKRLQKRGMTQDFSWARSARAYLHVYRQAMAS